MNLLILLFILMTPSGVKAEPKSIIELSTKVDMNCMEVKTIGACVKPNRKPPVGVKIQFWQPKILIETVKKPGDYTIFEYGKILQSVAKKAAEMELNTSHEISSGSTSASAGGSNVQFSKVHIYDFPLELEFDALCSDEPNPTVGIRYFSEADSFEWRKGNLEKKLPQSLIASHIGATCSMLPVGAEGQCMGNWGPLYPRTGFVISPSPAVGSVINALRATSIAGDKLSPHIVTSKLDFEPNLAMDKVQMVHPARTQCFPIGQNPSQWEQGSKDGHYVWIFWHRRNCCV